MKNLILLLTLATIMSCTIDSEPTLNSQLLGKWKLVELSGGIAGTTETPQTTGLDKSIEITSNTIKTYVNGILESESFYEIRQGKSIRTIEISNLIIYENGRKQSIELNDTNLILFDECNDCFQYKYVKE